MFVKICGITNELDARIAIEAGADAVGLILAESPRRVEPETARRIVASLPEDALTVAVFRREDPERVLRAFRAIGAKAVQIHDPSPEALVHLRKRVPFLIEAVAAGDDLPERAERTPADLLLVDAAEPGSGRSFDWSLLDPAPPGVKVVLAGGLTPETTWPTRCDGSGPGVWTCPAGWRSNPAARTTGRCGCSWSGPGPPGRRGWPRNDSGPKLPPGMWEATSS